MSKVQLQGNVSGTGVFTIAAPNSNVDRTLTLPNASGTLLTNSGTEAGAFSTLSVAGNNISAVNSLGFRNRIINGDMRIDQRNAGASVLNIVGTVYGADRWGVYGSQASKVTTQQNAGSVTPPAGFTNYVGVTVGAAANVSLGAADIFQLYQSVELFNVSDFAYGTASAQPITVSFWVRSSLTGTFSGSVYGAGSCPFSYTISAANTWEQKTISIPANTGFSFANTAGNATGLTLTFDLGAGSDWTASAGAWTSGNRTKATGSVSLVTTNNATFYITGVQLEAGSVATPFERRPFGTELALCQRYFQRSTFDVSGYGGVSGAILGQLSFPVRMRAVPTYTQLANNVNFFQANVTASSSTVIADEGRISLYRTPSATGNAQFSESFSVSAEL